MYQLEEFDGEFIFGFAWLFFRRFVSLEVDRNGRVAFVGVLDDIGDDRAREFPRAAQLALVAIRDSLNEVRLREGGSGMNIVYKTLEKYVPACVLLVAIDSVIGGSTDATD